MPSFNLQKGGSFNLAKSLSNVLIGLGWDPINGANVDIDAHAFGVVSRPDGSPIFYNDASHALTYANKGNLKVNPNKSFQTADGSLHHSGDDRSGSSSAGGDDEKITVALDKLPTDITEVQIWLTIHEPNGANFGIVKNAFARVVNNDSQAELARYNLGTEFASANSIQVGSLFKKDGNWTFVAIGAGVNVGLGDILQKLS